MITAATSFGVDNIGTWPVGRVVVVAGICVAIVCSDSGESIRSLTAMYHDGFVVQAGSETLSARQESGVWTAVTCRPFPSSRGMSLAQLDASAKAPWTNTAFLTVGAAAGSLAGRLPAISGKLAAVEVIPRTTRVLMIPRSNDVM